VLVQDNLSTHKPASLYEAFPPAEARRLVERFEWHDTPSHGGWLDMAESELSVPRDGLARDAAYCMGDPFPAEPSKSLGVGVQYTKKLACCSMPWTSSVRRLLPSRRLTPVVLRPVCVSPHVGARATEPGDSRGGRKDGTPVCPSRWTRATLRSPAASLCDAGTRPVTERRFAPTGSWSEQQACSGHLDFAGASISIVMLPKCGPQGSADAKPRTLFETWGWVWARSRALATRAQFQADGSGEPGRDSAAGILGQTTRGMPRESGEIRQEETSWRGVSRKRGVPLPLWFAKTLGWGSRLAPWSAI
jgi:hypothetical protein